MQHKKNCCGPGSHIIQYNITSNVEVTEEAVTDSEISDRQLKQREPLPFRTEQPGDDNMEHCGGTESTAPQTGLSVAALGWHG